MSDEKKPSFITPAKDDLKEAVREVLSEQAAIPQVMKVMDAPKKPRFPSAAMVPESDRAARSMRVFAPGSSGLILSYFIIGGVMVELPYSRMIEFKPYLSGGVFRGSGHKLTHKQCYNTISKIEQELFRKDDRWGTTFWVEGEGSDMDHDERFALLATRHAAALANMPYEQIRGVCTSLNIPINNRETMLNALATHYAKAELNAASAGAMSQGAKNRKEQLLK